MSENPNPVFETLIGKAIAARENAYAPYSSFRVGAALMTKDGRIFTGCNIENAAFSPSNCAERTAIFKAVSEGARNFAAIAVAGWKDGAESGPAYPCGVCRQVMMEFCDPKSFLVIAASSDGSYETRPLEAIMPYAFGPSNLV